MNNKLVEMYKDLKKEGEPLIALCETCTGNLITLKTVFSGGAKKLEFGLKDGKKAIYDKMQFTKLIESYNSNKNNKDKIKVACRYGTVFYFDREGNQVPDQDSILKVDSVEEMDKHLEYLGHTVIDGWKLVPVISIEESEGGIYPAIEIDDVKYIASILVDGTVYKKKAI